jgi:hypothetical protein
LDAIDIFVGSFELLIGEELALVDLWLLGLRGGFFAEIGAVVEGVSDGVVH